MRCYVHVHVSDVLFFSPYDSHRRDNTRRVLIQTSDDVSHSDPQLLTKRSLGKEGGERERERERERKRQNEIKNTSNNTSYITHL